MIFDLFGLGLVVFEITADIFAVLLLSSLITVLGGGLYIMRSMELWRGQE